MKHMQMVRLVGPAFPPCQLGHEDIKSDDELWERETYDREQVELNGELVEQATCRRCHSTLYRQLKQRQDTREWQERHMGRLESVAWAVTQILEGGR